MMTGIRAIDDEDTYYPVGTGAPGYTGMTPPDNRTGYATWEDIFFGGSTPTTGGTGTSTIYGIKTQTILVAGIALIVLMTVMNSGGGRRRR